MRYRCIIIGIVFLFAVSAVFALTQRPRKTSAPSLPSSLEFANADQTLLDIIVGRRWLVAIQNPYELRATGGFWGTIGDLALASDDTIRLNVRNVYDIDGPSEQFANERLPTPPAPFTTFMNMQRWFLRDANWDPDFAKSSRKGLELYEAETGSPSPFDGVIGITPTVLTDLLAIIGPMEIDGVRFDSRDALDTIIEEVELGYRQRSTPFFRRKEILEKLSQKVLDAMKQFSPSQALHLLSQLPRYQQERVIQLYARDEQVQATIRRLGWSGELVTPNESDYLFVVDSNLAALKTDAVVQRSTQATVHVKDSSIDVELHLRYRHTRQLFDYRTTRYRSYTRILVPTGSTVISSSGTMLNDKLHNPLGREYPLDVTTDQEKTQIGFFIAVEPRQQQEVVIRYRLPDSLRQLVGQRRQYSLYVQHQAGVPFRPLTLRVQSGTTLKPPIVVQRNGHVDELIQIPLP